MYHCWNFVSGQILENVLPFPENKILAVLLIVSWVASIILLITVHLCKSAGFDISYPSGSLFAIDITKISQGDRAAVCLVVVGAMASGTVIPFILYTAMYLNRRSFHRVHPVITEKPHTSSCSQVRSRRATVTYALMVVTFFAVSVYSENRS